MYNNGGDGKPRGFGFGGFAINKSDGGSVGKELLKLTSPHKLFM